MPGFVVHLAGIGAATLGLPGQWTHSAVREAERFTIETALGKGIAPRAEIGHPDQARRYLDMGVRHFCIGWDVAILFEWFKQSGQAMREIFSGAADNAGQPRDAGDTAYPRPTA